MLLIYTVYLKYLWFYSPTPEARKLSSRLLAFYILYSSYTGIIIKINIQKLLWKHGLISLLNDWTTLSLYPWFEENSKNYKMQVIILKEKIKERLE